MTWKLWLDDERPAPSDWGHAKDTATALLLCDVHGLPGQMSLDHDLGGDDTGMRFIKKLEGMFPGGPIPKWTIHSQNPVGKANMESYLKSWERELAEVHGNAVRP